MTLLKEIENKVYALPAKERGKLLHRLIASFDNTKNDSEIYDKELKRRISIVKSGKAVGVPVDEVFSKIESSLFK